MTYEQMIAVIDALFPDASYCIEDNIIDVTFHDFEGFNDDWEEEMREFNNEDAVDAFFEMLRQKCICHSVDFYTIYYFNNFAVRIGYDSYDI